MASFRINFQAQTTGDHYIGYRTYNDPPNTYTVLTVNITGAVPQLAHVDIPVPGNLYCAYDDIVYTGYLIAACQPQTDGNADGIPDLATQWTVTLVQQVDDCIGTLILCEATPIDTVTLPNGIISCAPNGTYTLDVTEANPGDEVVPANITITIVAGQPVPGSITIIDPGRYKAVPVVTLPVGVSGCSPNPVFTVTLEKCPVIDLLDYICSNHIELSGDTLIEPSVGETILLCANVATLAGLPPGYDYESHDGCHCEQCENVVVTTTASSGYVDVSYHTCWDGSNPLGSGLTYVTRRVAYDETVDLGCVMSNDITLDESNLVRGSTVLSRTPCV